MKAIYTDKKGEPVAISPDSAVIPNHRPWFIPDFGGEWSGKYLLALRIGRLGKGISPDFAYRYVDGATVAIHPVPSDGSVPESICNLMDGALILGDWVDAANLPFNVGTHGLCILTAGKAEVDNAVSRCSRHITLKTGDVLLLPMPCEEQALKHNLKLVAFDVTATQIMDVNVK